MYKHDTFSCIHMLASTATEHLLQLICLEVKQMFLQHAALIRSRTSRLMTGSECDCDCLVEIHYY